MLETIIIQYGYIRTEAAIIEAQAGKYARVEYKVPLEVMPRVGECLDCSIIEGVIEKVVHKASAFMNEPDKFSYHYTIYLESCREFPLGVDWDKYSKSDLTGYSTEYPRISIEYDPKY